MEVEPHQLNPECIITEQPDKHLSDSPVEINRPNKAQANANKQCRVCLKQSEEGTLIPLFSCKDLSDRFKSLMLPYFNHHFGVRSKKFDTSMAPDKICDTCLKDFHNAEAFINKAYESEVVLREELHRQDPVKGSPFRMRLRERSKAPKEHPNLPEPTIVLCDDVDEDEVVVPDIKVDTLLPIAKCYTRRSSARKDLMQRRMSMKDPLGDDQTQAEERNPMEHVSAELSLTTSLPVVKLTPLNQVPLTLKKVKKSEVIEKLKQRGIKTIVRNSKQLQTIRNSSQQSEPSLSPMAIKVKSKTSEDVSAKLPFVTLSPFSPAPVTLKKVNKTEVLEKLMQTFRQRRFKHMEGNPRSLQALENNSKQSVTSSPLEADKVVDKPMPPIVKLNRPLPFVDLPSFRHVPVPEPKVKKSASVNKTSADKSAEPRKKQPWEKGGVGQLCEHCGQVLTVTRSQHYRKFVQCNKAAPKCGECGKRFKDKNHLSRHMFVHSDERTFQCHMCPMKYRHDSSLKLHLRLHVEGNAHVCDACGKSFSTRHYMLVHRRVHVDPSLAVFCDYCSMKLENQEQLGHHIEDKHMDKYIEDQIEMGQVLPEVRQCRFCVRKFFDPKRISMHERQHWYAKRQSRARNANKTLVELNERKKAIKSRISKQQRRIDQ